MGIILNSHLRNQRAWYMYDFASSAFTTSVITVFIGPYLTTVAKNAAISGFVDVLGINIFADSYFTYCITLSVILQVFLLPAIGAIADHSGKKKELLAFFAFLGSISTMGLFFLNGTNYKLGGILLVLSNLFYGSSMVVYNSFLNEIASEDERDKVSSNGYAIGYLGGGILLALNLVLLSFHESLSIELSMAVRISLLSAGLWWLAFSIIPIIKIKILTTQDFTKNYIRHSFKEMIQTISDARKYPKTLIYLLAYLLYNDGVQSVIVVSALFGQEAMNLDISTLTTVILLVQFVAFFGAKVFNYLAIKFSTKISLLICLVIWSLAIIYAYAFLDSKTGFYAMGIVIGFVLGGTQALSRSLYSLMIPTGKEAEYFSLYEVSERGTSWMGPLMFGLSLQFTGSYHIAILSLLFFFVSGGLMLFFLDVNKAIHLAGNQIPQFNKKLKSI